MLWHEVMRKCTVPDIVVELGDNMPTSTKSVAEYRERAKKLRLAAENTVVAETREQLLVVAEDYEDLAEGRGLIEGQSAD